MSKSGSFADDEETAGEHKSKVDQITVGEIRSGGKLGYLIGGLISSIALVVVGIAAFRYENKTEAAAIHARQDAALQQTDNQVQVLTKLLEHYELRFDHVDRKLDRLFERSYAPKKESRER